MIFVMVSLLAVTEVQQPSMVGNFPASSSWSSDQARRYLEETAEMTMSATFISLLNIDGQSAYLFSLQLVDGNELLAVISVSIPPTIGVGETIKGALEDYQCGLSPAGSTSCSPFLLFQNLDK